MFAQSQKTRCPSTFRGNAAYKNCTSARSAQIRTDPSIVCGRQKAATALFNQVNRIISATCDLFYATYPVKVWTRKVFYFTLIAMQTELSIYRVLHRTASCNSFPFALHTHKNATINLFLSAMATDKSRYICVCMCV